MVDLVSLYGNLQSPKDYAVSDCRKLDMGGDDDCKNKQYGDHQYTKTQEKILVKLVFICVVIIYI